MLDFYKGKEGNSWALAMFIVILGVVVNIGLNRLMNNWLANPQLSPGGTPPWYFIQRDFISGISASIGLLLSILIIVLVCKRFKIEWSPALYFTCLTYFSSIHDTIFIYLHSGNVLNIKHATVAWATFDDYLNAPWKSLWVPICYVLIFGTPFITRQWFIHKRKTKESNDIP